MDGPAVLLACGRVDELCPSCPDGPEWLGEEESVRAAAIRSPLRRSQFIAGRWLLRTLLSREFGRDPRAWRLSAPGDAPPAVHGTQSPVHLGLAHSGDFVAAGLATCPFGLDIEAPRRTRDIDGLARLCFTGAEQALFDATPAQEREALFHGIWTVKEAWIKRRRESVAPRRLSLIDVRPVKRHPADASVWRTQNWTLAVVAQADAKLRWHTPVPPHRSLWRVRDAQAPGLSPA